MPSFQFGFSIEAKGYRSARGTYAQRSARLAKARRELAREVGRETVKQLKLHAPSESGLFKDGLFYRTYERGDTVEVRFYAGGEHAYLLPFLVNGTVDHIIPKGGAAAQKAKGYPLRFFWEKGPRGPGVYRFWQVHHPGTNPDPFVSQTLAVVRPGLADKMQRRAARVAFL